MKKIFQYIAMTVALVAMASCSQDETFEPDAPKVVKGMEFVVSDFPAYDDPQTRTIGNPEDGKTEWVEGDEILMIFDSPKYGVQSATLRYTESQWMLPEGVTFKYLEGETPEISALYSPICEVSGGMFVTADEYGTAECLWGSCNLSADGTSINISFGGRTYSRLRIAAEVGQELTVTTTDFTPAGAASAATGAYTLIANANGNAYLYGIFAEGATVSVKDGSIPIVDYTFSKEVHPNGTIAGKSYALDALPYLAFTASAEQTMTISVSGSYTLHESLQYSVKGSKWAQLKAGTAITFGGANGGVLRLRGQSSGGTASTISKYAKISFGNSNVPVACSGDIRNLIDYKNYATVNTDEARFCYLFNGCTSLTTAPKLPATTLADNCYNAMFKGCKNLTSAPELPAKIATESCYSNMFYGCTSLTTAPELPATTLAEYCYGSMFEDCTNLTTAPKELPAMTLADNCYYQMFNSCKNLSTAPELPAMTLAKNCYEFMFWDCTNLTAAPELPAMTLASSCYYNMFNGCTNLTAAPELPATTLADYCYNAMFQGCKNLTSAPELPATILADYCYASMFQDCTNLTTAPELPATTLAERCYKLMFRDCEKLNSITMLATNISATKSLDGWVIGVASTGTFTKAASLEQGTESGQIPTGIYGIPEGWTVKNYGE